MKKLFCFCSLIILLFVLCIRISPDDYILSIESADGTVRNYTELEYFGSSGSRVQDTDSIEEGSSANADDGSGTGEDAAGANEGESNGSGADSSVTGSDGTGTDSDDENTDGQLSADAGDVVNSGETEAADTPVDGFESYLTADYFEMDVPGSTGWTSTSLTLRQEASAFAASVQTLAAGTAFRIEEETGDWWYVTLQDGTAGYVQHSYCMINLPDVLPLMEYDITNAYDSIFKSSGYEIEGVTGQKLYSAGTVESEGKVWNEKLGRYEYLAPAMYSFAKKIAVAQYNAYTLTGGRYTLKVYDSYRPHSITIQVASALESLYNSNSVVRENIDYSTTIAGSVYTWGTGWFLAQSLSTHNTGSAIDVTLCEYDDDRGEYKELYMQTDMHELSTAAVKYYSPNAEKIPENYDVGMNENAILLDTVFIGGTYGTYSFTDTGLTTLASEWWHFQDNDTHRRVRSYASSGCDFQVTECLSR
ncbi:MAG: SH3 domain-containing protein [Lachnospiraceae bacterium]|nr:SH3 domain-containing protein [Lachnospiraceae bacterium]